MPTIRQFGEFRITMYFEDHNPPHFHVVSPAQEVVIEIATPTVMAGPLAPAKLRVAQVQAAKRQPEPAPRGNSDFHLPISFRRLVAAPLSR
ncbi:MAG: DUF4160 domain-containing protein [Alphaproteobacteria bacterium]|nr:DUF4160 domain-containing protein [Alphaproteobacteria bacterium]